MLHALQPALLEDESILGYLQRFSFIAYSGDFKPLVRSLLPIKAVQAPWLIPSCLASLSSALESLPATEVLLARHTIFPAVTAFLSSEVHDAVARKMSGGTGTQGLYFTLGLMHSLKESTPATQNFCPSCVAESLSQHGHSYWRRTHQFPYIGTCGLHGDILRTGSGCCGVTKRNSNSSYLPGRGCSCERPSVEVIPYSVGEHYLMRDRAISKFLAEALTVNWQAMSPREVNLLFRHTATQRGFARGRYIDSIALTAAFKDFFGEKFLDAYSSNSAAETGWIAEAFRGGIPKSVIRNALIVHFLYHDLAGFLEHWNEGSWRATPAPTRRAGAHPANSAEKYFDTTVRDEMRARLISWKSSAACPTRTEAQKNEPTAVRWVRTNDRDWYVENFPIVPRAQFAQAMSRTWAARQQNAEFASTQHVLKRYKELMESQDLPVRITKTQLHRGLAKPFSRLPETLKVVDNLLESKAAYNERKAVWLFLNAPLNIPEVTRIQNAYEKTRVPKFRIRELLRGLDFRTGNLVNATRRLRA